MLHRRDFLKLSLGAGAAYSAAALPGLGSVARAEGFAPVMSPFLVNVTLVGGPDFRHLMPPPFSSQADSFGFRFWQALASAHDLSDDPAAYQERWENDYTHEDFDGIEFGILKECGWFRDMWAAGKVAILCNMYGATDRNHVHARMVLDQGNMSSEYNDHKRPGWGGRLAAVSGEKALALTNTPRPFCFGPHPTDSENHDKSFMISARNTRNMRLYSAADEKSAGATIDRSLRHYYTAKAAEMPNDSIYRQFIELERTLRDFGRPFDERLASVTIPGEIALLHDTAEGVLNDAYFGQQIANLYDCIAANDILGMRVASLEFLNWDSHDEQKESHEKNFSDLFGHGKALDVLYRALPVDARENMVMVLGGEFGRQIRANRKSGTDHGEGTIMLVIGESVRGGVYGDMFPQSELEELDAPSPQIKGLTAFEHAFAAVSDRILPGSADTVFPNRFQYPIEAGMQLDRIFV